MKVLGGAAIESLLSVGECVDVVAEAMRSVARQAGVSTMTVSRVLSQPGSVAPETRERILQAIGAQGYVPNDVAGSLHARRARCGAVWRGVVWCVPHIANSVFSDTLQGLNDALRPAHRVRRQHP